MRRFFRDMNPTVRGFGVIALIALVVVVLQLERTLTALFILARIAFFFALAYFIYLLWRDPGTTSRRGRRGRGSSSTDRRC